MDLEGSLFICVSNILCACMCTRAESGLGDLDDLGHFDQFLMGQVGLIHKLNYLDVIQILIDHMFITKWHWHSVSE